MCLPKRSHTIAGWPAHDEAPRWVGAPLTHLLYAAGCPHLTHSDLGLHLKMGGGPIEDTMCFSKLNTNILIIVYIYIYGLCQVHARKSILNMSFRDVVAQEKPAEGLKVA